MQSPSLAPSRAPGDDADERDQIARLALIFICSTSPRSVEFAKRKLKDLFGYDAEESSLREAQMKLLAETSTAISAILRRGRS